MILLINSRILMIKLIFKNRVRKVGYNIIFHINLEEIQKKKIFLYKFLKNQTCFSSKKIDVNVLGTK